MSYQDQPSDPNSEFDGLMFRSHEVPHQVCVPFAGPFGSARLASRARIERLMASSSSNPEQYIRLLPAYAVTDDGDIVHLANGLSLPAGVDSPNTLFIGRSGARKTESGILPAFFDVIRRGANAFYLNTKGRHQTLRIAKVAKYHGRSVRIFAPGNPTVSLGFNPLAYVASMEQAAVIAEAIVSSVAGQARFGEGGWTYRTVADYLKFAIYALATEAPSERSTLVELRRIMNAKAFNAFAKQHPDVDALARYGEYFLSDNRNAETNVATLRECTAFIDCAEAFLSKDELPFQEALSEGVIAVIEVSEHRIGAFHVLLNLIMETFISTANQLASESDAGTLPIESFGIIDELPAAGCVPSLARTLHTGRERRLHFIAATQGIDQIYSVYRDDASTVLSGFQTKVVFGGGLDVNSADYFSRLSGQATVCLPNNLPKPVTSAEELASAESWELSARPLLLPSEIANPVPHPLLGPPATVFIGDGSTPPFHAWLTPCFEDGKLQRILDHSDITYESLYRKAPLAPPARPAEGTPTCAVSNIKGWSKEQLEARLSEVEEMLDLESASDSAKGWWRNFRKEQHLELVLRTAEEIAKESATVQEFFLAYVYSGVDNIQGNILYMLYLRFKRREEERKKNERVMVPTLSAEPTGFAVVLADVGPTPDSVIKIISELTGQIASEKLIENVPSVIGYCMYREHGNRAVENIEMRGATAYIDVDGNKFLF